MSESTPPKADPNAPGPHAANQPEPAGPASASSQSSRTATRPAPTPPKALPPYRVLLHNDDHNDMLYVVQTITQLTPLKPAAAQDVMMTAHTRGVAQVLLTHKERAELYAEQFKSKGLTATIEPA